MAAGGELGRCPEALPQDESSGLLPERSDPRVARVPDGLKRFRPAVGLATVGAVALATLMLVRGGSAPVGLRRSASGFQLKDEAKACCSEYKLECMSCLSGETPEAYCKHPDEDGVVLCKNAYGPDMQEKERAVLLHALADLMDLPREEREHEMTAEEKRKYGEEKKIREQEELVKLKAKHEEEAKEEGQKMVLAWDREKEQLDHGVQPKHEMTPFVSSNASGPTLYCFSLMMPFGYEPSLLATQRMRGIGIFACDESQVFSNQTHVLVGDGADGTTVPSPVPISLVNHSLAVAFGGRWWTALNTGVFNRLWQEVLREGRYRRHDWVVKVDPDAVFFPSRLRSMLALMAPMNSVKTHGKVPDQLKCGVCQANDKPGTTCFAHVRSLQAQGHSCSKALRIASRPTSEQDGCDCSCDDFACDLPDEAMYLNNCKYGLHGPIEVFSRRAVAMYVAGLPKCVELMQNPWGEDKFMDQCMMKLGIKRVDEFSLLSETACGEQPAPCGSADAAFHPFKSIPSYFQCWAYADKYGNWTTANSTKPQPRKAEHGASKHRKHSEHRENHHPEHPEHHKAEHPEHYKEHEEHAPEEHEDEDDSDADDHEAQDLTLDVVAMRK